jgi:hypothetical protein
LSRAVPVVAIAVSVVSGDVPVVVGAATVVAGTVPVVSEAVFSLVELFL